jgi:hypothetical protein
MNMKQIFTILIAAFFALNLAFADSFSEDEILENLPNLASQSNMGTEFVLTFHPIWEEKVGNNAIRIMVVSEVTSHVVLSIPGAGFQEQKITIPNSVLEFTLTPEVALLYSKTDREPPLDDRVWPGRGIIITSDEPILVYAIIDYTYTSDGYLALPVEYLGKEYIVSAWEDIVPNNGDSRIQWLTSYTSIVAAYDNTRVKFTMGGNDNSQTPSGLHPGENITKIMMKGDVWLIPAIGPYSDVTGSQIESNKPVAVISGNFCSYVPRNIASCDYLIEQEFPTNMWGDKYLVSPIINREKNSWVRIFAKEDSTKIFRDGIQIGLLKSAGGIEGTGWLNMREDVDESEKRPVIISGDKPIRVVQYNTGGFDDGQTSDPFQMNVIPEKAMSKNAIFMSDFYRDTYLNFVYRGDEEGNFPKNSQLKIYDNGHLTNVLSLSEWQHTEPEQFNSSNLPDNWFYTTFTLKPYMVYEISSSDKFAAYIYASGAWASYGFNANYNDTENLRLLDTAKPYCDFTNDCYGNVSGMFKDTITNSSLESNYDTRITEIELLESNSYNYNLDYDINEHDFSEIEFALVVDDLSRNAKATINVSDRAGNTETFVFLYTIFDLEMETESKHFQYDNGKNTIKDFVIKNKAHERDIFVFDLYIEKNPDLFEITLNDFDLENPLEAREEYSFIVEYKPEDSGYISDNLILAYYCENANKIEELIYPITAGIYKEFEIPSAETLSFPARFPLNEFYINIINALDDKSVQINEISFSDNFGNMTSEELFRVDEEILSGTSLPISISPYDSISLSINPLLPNEGIYEGFITIIGDSTSEDISFTVEAYETEALINNVVLSGYEKSEIKDSIVIENTGNNDLYLFGTVFSGDVGIAYFEKIILNAYYDLSQYKIIKPGGSDALSVTGNSTTADTTDGSIIIYSNAKNELTSNIGLYVETLSSILDYKLLSSFQSHYDNRNDKLIIDLTSREIYYPEIQLIDMLGNKALNINKHIMRGEKTIELDCSSLLSGIYLLNITNEGQPVASEKVVIVR